LPWVFQIDFETSGNLQFTTTSSARKPPGFKPDYDYEHTSDAHPKPSKVMEVWSLSGLYYVLDTTQSAMVDLVFSELLDRLEDPTDRPKRFRWTLDGVDKWDMRTVADGGLYDGGRVASVSFDEMVQGGGAAFLKVDMKVHGEKVVVGVDTVEQDLDVRYEKGLEVRTLTTTVTTSSSVSARGQVESLGVISRPSAFWQRDQAKSPYVNVKRNKSDTEASGTSSVREQGVVIPTGTNEWGEVLTTTKTPDGTRYRLQVSAQGSGALAAVTARNPGDTLSEEIVNDKRALAVQGTYITEEPPEDQAQDEGVLERSRTFRVHGGGRPKTYTPISGSDQLWEQQGSRRALFLRESYTVRVKGATAIGSVLLEGLLYPDRFDLQRSSEQMPRITERGITPASDIWERSASRVYVFASSAPSPTDLFKAALTSREGTGTTQPEADFEQAGAGVAAVKDIA